MRRPVISKPGTMRVVSQTRKALMTKVNKPRVMTFKGKVRSLIMGLMKVLRSPKTRATRIPVVRLSTMTSGMK